MGKEQDLLKDYNEAYDQSYSIWNEALLEMRRDLKFFLGDQWDAAQKAYLQLRKREPLVFNRIMRTVRLVSGHQMKTRLAIKVEATTDDDGQEKAASQLGGCCMNVMQMSYRGPSGYTVMGDAFRYGSLISGLNLVELYIDRTMDPVSGDIRFARLPYNTFMIDPATSSLSDLSDCNYLVRRRYLAREMVRAIVPRNRAEDLKNLRPKGGLDGKYPHYYPMKDLRGKDLFRYDEFFHKTSERRNYLINKRTGELIPTDFGRRKLAEFLDQEGKDGVKRGVWWEMVPHWEERVNLAVFVEEKNFYEGEEPWGINEFPFVPVYGFWSPEHDDFKEKIQGLVRCQRDPAIESNKRRLKLLDVFDSVVSAGIKVKQSALVNPESAFHTGQGVAWIIKDEANMQDIEIVMAPSPPAAMFQAIELLDKDQTVIPGATDEIFGMPSNEDVEVAGILAKMRQGAALTLFQDLFDQYRDAKKLLGQKLVKMIQSNYTAHKVFRLIKEEPVPEFYDREMGIYNCTVQEGLLSDSQKQMYFHQLAFWKLKFNAPIPWSELLEASPIEFKEELRQRVQQMEQMQSRMSMMQLQSQMTEQELLKAEIMARLGVAQARKAKAEHDLAGAGLDRAKAMAEIENLSAERFFSLVRLALDLEKAGQPGLGTNQGQVIPMQKPGEMVTRR